MSVRKSPRKVEYKDLKYTYRIRQGGEIMKKVALAVLIITMIIFLVNPLSSYARGGGRGGDHGDEGYWWVPLSVIGVVVVVWTAAVLARYHSHYYAPPAVVIRETPPEYVKPAPSVTPSSAERISVYPRHGQSAELQAKDRSECHSWAVGQTHYDPTQSASGMPETQLNQMSVDYIRAMDACLDARGYTVK